MNYEYSSKITFWFWVGFSEMMIHLIFATISFINKNDWMYIILLIGQGWFFSLIPGSLILYYMRKE